MGKLAISHQAEGMTVKRLEEKSAEMSGRSMDEWRRAVLDKMQAGDKSMQGCGQVSRRQELDGREPEGAGGSRRVLAARRQWLRGCIRRYALIARDDDPAFKQYQKDVKEALDKQKKALEKAKQDAIDTRLKAGGGDRVETGVPSVLAGKDKREIVTVTSPTQSGDKLKEGRQGTYAGVDQQPVSTLGSVTVQGQAVVTAIDSVLVFGPPTSAPPGK